MLPQKKSVEKHGSVRRLLLTGTRFCRLKKDALPLLQNYPHRCAAPRRFLPFTVAIGALHQFCPLLVHLLPERKGSAPRTHIPHASFKRHGPRSGAAGFALTCTRNERERPCRPLPPRVDFRFAQLLGSYSAYLLLCLLFIVNNIGGHVDVVTRSIRFGG